MTAIAPLLFSNFSQLSLATSQLGITISATANVVQDFFMNVFLNPGQNVVAIGVMAVVVIGAAAGLAFLTKKIYEKCLPKQPPPQDTLQKP